MKRYEEYKSTGISELGKIPTHWDLKRLYGIGTTFYKGCGITKLEINSKGGTQCLRYADIYTKFQISFSQTSCYTDVKIIATPVWAKYGDIFFAGTGEKVEEIGKNIVYLGTEPLLVGGDIIGMRHQQNAKYLSYLLSSHPIQLQKSKGKSKLKVVHITANELKNIYLPLPPSLEQEAIVDFLDKKILKINSYVAERERVMRS